MSSLKRPQRGETHEDLLTQQQQFLTANKIQKLNDNNKSTADDGSQQRPPAEDTIADNHDIPPIVTTIVERDVSADGSDFYGHSWATIVPTVGGGRQSSTATGFPKAFRRSDQLVPKSGQSLFAQQMARRSSAQASSGAVGGGDRRAKSPPPSVVSGYGLGVDNWRADIDRIRADNHQTLQQMSAEEIEETRKELLKSLSQKSVDFLVSKSARRQRLDSREATKDTTSATADCQTDVEMTVAEEAVIDDTVLPIKPSEVVTNKWLNMDVVEKSKMSWMGDIQESDSTSTAVGSGVESTAAEAAKSLNARFDFEGNLIDKTVADCGVQTALYHHREDESSAGYTTDELYTLLQSTFAAQKVLGLQVLSKVLAKAFNGLYDQCFNENITEQLLKNSALILITRLCLDDTTDSVWRAAITAMHAMLCNTATDELFLDRGFALFAQCLRPDTGVRQLKPSYAVTAKSAEELTDEQLMKLDVIHCLVKRTSLPQRIRYLLETNRSQLDSRAVDDLLDILIRMARHSPDCRQDIVNCPFLLSTIIDGLIPVSVVTGDRVFDRPNARAVKLIRLLVDVDEDCPSGTAADIIRTFPQLIEALKVYLTLNPENCANSRETLRVSIEALRLWISLLSQNLCVEDFWQMFPVLIKQLQYCSTLDPISHQNDYDFQYASTLIAALKTCVQRNKHFQAFNDLVLMTTMKWLTLIKNAVIVPAFDANLCLFSGVQYLLAAGYQIQTLADIVSQIVDSKAIQHKLLNSLIENSNLVKLETKSQPHRRDSPNLPSFGSVLYRSHRTVPIMNNESPIGLILAVIHTLKTQPNNDNMSDKLHAFKDYIQRVATNLKHDIKLNLFDCYELMALSEICSLCFVTSIASTTSSAEDIHCYHNIALLMISFTPNETIKHKLLTEVVFNKTIYAIESSGIAGHMSELSLRDKEFEPNIVDNLDSIKTLYGKHSRFDSHHWLFDPLIRSVETKNSATLDEIRACLVFISAVVKRHRNYCHQLIQSSSALYCLISSVFLISEEVFFDDGVQRLLYVILKTLLAGDGIRCQISDRVPYYDTCGDFYQRFVDQFESVSYGNKLFINYLLVFCQLKCSPLFRTKLFVDFPTAFRIIQIPFDELLIPIDNFLSPIESDYQTLEAMLKSLLCGALTPVDSPLLYAIAVHHLNHRLFRDCGANRSLLSAEHKPTFDRLIRSVHNSRNDVLKQHLLKYSHFDCKNSFSLAISL